MSYLKDTITKYKDGKIDKSQFIEEMHAQHVLLNDYQEHLGSSKLESIELNKNGIYVRTKSGIKMKWDVQDARSIPSEIINFGNYEFNEFKLIMNIIRPEDVVFDIGANIGWYSLNIASAKTKTKIFAFEPIPYTYSFLKENISLSQAKNIKPFNIGFSDTEGQVVFFFDSKLTGATSLRNIYHKKDKLKVKATVQRLDDFVAKKKISRIDFVKIDVEGAELLVLKGGLETLKQLKPILFVEMLRKWSAEFDYHPNDIIEMLADIGYSCYTIKDGKLVDFHRMTDTTIETNFFFADPKKHNDVLKKVTVPRGGNK
ncbi:MAG: FkbM family methyltransferase [Euryarchaeota archaeon]|nr:FkbM family methyltransferase [Euryarchaeota archaeon]MBU4038105.1 FkbM family methyltransferase [Pseudomonadota bacterium]